MAPRASVRLVRVSCVFQLGCRPSALVAVACAALPLTTKAKRIMMTTVMMKITPQAAVTSLNQVRCCVVCDGLACSITARAFPLQRPTALQRSCLNGVVVTARAPTPTL